MLLPTLVALDGLGGSGGKDEIDDAVVALMGLSDEQHAVALDDVDGQQVSGVGGEVRPSSNGDPGNAARQTVLSECLPGAPRVGIG